MFGSGLRGPRVAAVFALSLAVLGTQPASACGGCFGPPVSPTVVTGHRMAFAVSETQTVLWDQFQYQGDPEDFSWVLPVRPGAYVEVAEDAWLSALDTFTSTSVVAPVLNCSTAGGQSDGGCACGGMSSDAARGSSAESGSQGPPGVRVVRQERVGPYETVVLRSEDPDALTDWLLVNGYSVPDEIRPVIDAYVDEGNDFLALRLAPNTDVSQMEPVRVITPGGDYLLPLRMVAAGVGSYVDIKLFVIAERRYTMPDMAEVAIDERNLEFDFRSNGTNYPGLRSAALAQNAGKSALVPYARRRPFDTPNITPGGAFPVQYAASGAGVVVDSLAELYFAQAGADGVPPGSAGGSGLPQTNTCKPPLTDPRLVVRCPSEAPCAGSVTELSSASFVCGGYTDLSTALTGMRPSQVWLTRFEMNLPSTALDVDCAVEPALADVEITPFLQARKLKNPPCSPPLFSASTGTLLFGLWASSALLARRRKRALERC